MYHRRNVLGIIGCSVGLVAGCGAYDFPRYRRLGFEHLKIDGRDSNYEIEARVRVEAEPEDEEWATFHQVGFIVTTKTGDRVCSTTLGEVTTELRRIDLTCAQFPYAISLKAEESPCDVDTEIERAIYDGKHDEKRVWRVTEQECTKK